MKFRFHAGLIIVAILAFVAADDLDLANEGKNCSHWSDCASNDLICYRGECAKDDVVGSFCNRTNRCLPGYHCRRRREGPPGGFCARGCRVDFHCPERHVCIDRDCVFDQGRSLMCQTYLDCPRAHWCKTIVSRLSGICMEGCLEDKHCGSAMECLEERCVPIPQNLSCTSDNDCEPNSHCNFEDQNEIGQCRAGCTKDEHCFRRDPNAICIKTACVVKSCRNDDECPQSHYCGINKDDEEGICVPKDECDDDEECDAGYYCSANKTCEINPTTTTTTTITTTTTSTTTTTTTMKKKKKKKKKKPANRFRSVYVCVLFFCHTVRVPI